LANEWGCVIGIVMVKIRFGVLRVVGIAMITLPVVFPDKFPIRLDEIIRTLATLALANPWVWPASRARRALAQSPFGSLASEMKINLPFRAHERDAGLTAIFPTLPACLVYAGNLPSTIVDQRWGPWGKPRS